MFMRAWLLTNKKGHLYPVHLIYCDLIALNQYNMLLYIRFQFMELHSGKILQNRIGKGFLIISSRQLNASELNNTSSFSKVSNQTLLLYKYNTNTFFKNKMQSKIK